MLQVCQNHRKTRLGMGKSQGRRINSRGGFAGTSFDAVARGDGDGLSRFSAACATFESPFLLERSNFKPNQSESFSPASRIEQFSIFMTRSRTFPPPHWLKQWKTFFSVSVSERKQA